MTFTQEQLLCLMKEIDNICRKHDIDYSLAGGSLIGAIRHRGYIPWDDDMDIWMSQSNWYKLLDAIKTDGLPEDRVLETPELNRDFSNMFGRYSRKDTTAIHKSQIGHEDTAGQIIDIFVFDPMIDTKQAFDDYLNNIMLYSDLMNSTIGYETRFDIDPWRYPKYLLKCKIHGKDKVLKSLEKNFFKYNDTDFTKYVMRWGGNPFLLDRDIFEEYRYVDFEDTQFKIFSKYNKYLTWQYGDEWEQIPPHDEQQGHDAIANDKVGYKVIRDDYFPYINRKKLARVYKVRKFKHLLAGKVKHKYQDEVQSLKAAKIKLELEKRISLSTSTVYDMLNNDDYEGLRIIFDDFITEQLDVGFVGRIDNFTYVSRYYTPILIDIDEDYWPIIIKLLIQTNRMSKAGRLLNIYKTSRGKLTDELASLYDEIIEVRKAADAYYMGDYKSSLALSENVLNSFSNNYQAMKIKLRVILLHPELADDYDKEAASILSTLMKQFKNDGEIAKYLGDYYFRNDREKAIEFYKYAYSHTNNGYILLHLRDIFDKLNIEPPELMEGV